MKLQMVILCFVSLIFFSSYSDAAEPRSKIQKVRCAGYNFDEKRCNKKLIYIIGTVNQSVWTMEYKRYLPDEVTANSNYCYFHKNQGHLYCKE